MRYVKFDNDDFVFYRRINCAMQTESNVIGIVGDELTTFGISHIDTGKFNDASGTVFVDIIPLPYSYAINSIWIPYESFRYYAETLKLIHSGYGSSPPPHSYLATVAAMQTNMNIKYI